MRYVGMDVHAETIAMVEEDGLERDVGVIPNRPDAIRKCLKRLGRPDELRCCYEARAHRLRAVLAAGADGDRLHGGGADIDPHQGGRSGEG